MLGGPILSAYPGLDADMLPLALIVVILGRRRQPARRVHRQSSSSASIYTFGTALFPDARLFHPVPADDRGHCLPPRKASSEGAAREPPCARSCLGVAVALPAYAGEFYVNLASQVLIAAIFAMSLNLLVGYGGLTSLGHASFLGVRRLCLRVASHEAGSGQRGCGGLSPSMATTGLAASSGLVALRATGLGFLMITLAFSQILWGLAYRWVSVTNGDNGLAGITRLAPFGVSLDSAAAFYWLRSRRLARGISAMAAFVSSAFGATLRGVRDQPRRMAALGHNIWLIRWITFVYAGFWGGVAGLLYVYYHKYIHPDVHSRSPIRRRDCLASSPAASGTLGGPIAGAALMMMLKNYASAYIERWNMLLGFVFLVIVLVVPEGIVPGLRRLAGAQGRWKVMTAPALDIQNLFKKFGGLPATRHVTLACRGRRAASYPRSKRRGEDDPLQPDHRRHRPDLRLDQTVWAGNHGVCPLRAGAHLGIARTYQIITLFQKDTLEHNVMLALLGLSRRRYDMVRPLASMPQMRERAQRALARVALDHVAQRKVSDLSYGEKRRVEIALALAQEPKLLLLDEPMAGLSTEERTTIRNLIAAIPRDHHPCYDRARYGQRAEPSGQGDLASLRASAGRRRSRNGRCRSADAGGVSWPLTH